MVFNERRELLLVQRAVEPGKGLWCLPGGFQEIDETPESCALRELREETGIQGRIEEMLGLEMSPHPWYRSVLVIGYRCAAVGGTLAAGDDAAAAAYFPLPQLPELAFRSHARIIARAGAGPARPAVDLRLPWGAYVVTSGDHLQVAREACRGGARIVQYRDKDAPAGQRLETARLIRAVTRASGTLFIVNDQLDIALLAGADGVHLGQDDIAIPTPVRCLRPGRSSASPVPPWSRPGKPSAGAPITWASGRYSPRRSRSIIPMIGLEGLRQIAAEVSLPLVAIGGINLDNMAAVKAAGIGNVAMVREFQEDTAARVAAVNAFFK